MSENYYDILSIPPDASTAQIKAAYRRLALKFHPDKNKGDLQASLHFRKIRTAYETLINPQKRKEYDSIIAGKSAGSQELHIMRASNAIRIYPSSRIVMMGDTLELIGICDLPCQQFVISGLDSFDILNGPEYAVEIIENRKRLFIRYLIKPRHTGYLPIGPAWALFEHIRFESERIFIRVKEKGAPIFQFDLSRGENIFYIVVISFFIFLFGLTFYNIRERGLMPDELLLDDGLRWHNTLPKEPLQLNTGTIPFASFHDTAYFRTFFSHIIRIKNNTDQDVVVFIVEKKTNKTVRNHYIRAHDTYEITYLPDGDYYMKMMSGNDWDFEKKIKGVPLSGRFKRNLRYEWYTDSSETIVLRYMVDGDSWQHSVYEINLHQVSEHQVKDKGISEQEFFKRE